MLDKPQTHASLFGNCNPQLKRRGLNKSLGCCIMAFNLRSQVDIGECGGSLRMWRVGGTVALNEQRMARSLICPAGSPIISSDKRRFARPHVKSSLSVGSLFVGTAIHGEATGDVYM